jgi:hypothetical protein
MTKEIVDPLIGKIQDDSGRSAQRSGGMISASSRRYPTEPPQPLTEDNDTRRVDFSCHPLEPVKVLDDSLKPVRCLICGQVET